MELNSFKNGIVSWNVPENPSICYSKKSTNPAA